MKILIVDDELPILDSLGYNFEKEGYEVIKATDGEKALKLTYEKNPDLIILDLMLPQLSGLDVCRVLRQEKIFTPIIMLTAKDKEIDKVVGLEIGADDYVTKPFSLQELMARVKAIFRRVDALKYNNEVKDKIKIGNLKIDFEKYEIRKNEKLIKLSPKEFELLKILVKNKEKVLPREYLINYVWGNNFYGDYKTLDVHIRWLREKIEENPASPKCIITVRGVGYKFKI